MLMSDSDVRLASYVAGFMSQTFSYSASGYDATGGCASIAWSPWKITRAMCRIRHGPAIAAVTG